MYDWQDERIITQLPKRKNGKRRVVLTFDDGPSEYLEEILRILAYHQVEAVFFWLTSNLSNMVYDKERLISNHEIGLHGIDHEDMRALSKKTQEIVIRDGVSELERAINRKIRLYRPPFGQYDSKLLEVLQENNLQPLFWDVASLDWELKDRPEQIVQKVLDHIQDGSIILLHEIEQTVLILDKLISSIHERGYEIVLPD